MARSTNETSSDETIVQGSATRGPQLTRIQLAGDPHRWADAGFDVGAGGAITVGSTVVVPDGAERGPVRLGFEPTPGTDDLDGIGIVSVPGASTDRAATSTIIDPATITEAPPASGSSDGHRNCIVSIDHVVIATDDGERTIASFEKAGFPARRTIVTERFGTPLLQTFLWAGDVMFEVIGPPEPVPVAATTPEARLFGITFVTSDMDRTVGLLGEMIGEPKPAVQPNRMIATLRTRELGIRTRIAIMTPHVAGGD